MEVGGQKGGESLLARLLSLSTLPTVAAFASTRLRHALVCIIS